MIADCHHVAGIDHYITIEIVGATQMDSDAIERFVDWPQPASPCQCVRIADFYLADPARTNSFQPAPRSNSHSERTIKADSETTREASRLAKQESLSPIPELFAHSVPNSNAPVGIVNATNL